MHIKEVVIDGFKSYATRTVLQGFDQQFNAITGLNGSGKSNILDAICFVLGISNLSQVRVSNLQELVYKQGQAGVTKASVTLVFSNVDKKGRCVGALVCMCVLAAQGGKAAGAFCVCVFKPFLPTHGGCLARLACGLVSPSERNVIAGSCSPCVFVLWLPGWSSCREGLVAPHFFSSESKEAPAAMPSALVGRNLNTPDTHLN